MKTAVKIRAPALLVSHIHVSAERAPERVRALIWNPEQRGPLGDHKEEHKTHKNLDEI